MRLVTIILTIIILSSSLRAEKITIYTYDSFVSEWGPGPIIKEKFFNAFSRSFATKQIWRNLNLFYLFGFGVNSI